MKTNSVVLLLSKLCNFRLPGFPNNPCGLTGMLNVDKSVAFDADLTLLMNAEVAFWIRRVVLALFKRNVGMNLMF